MAAFKVMLITIHADLNPEVSTPEDVRVEQVLHLLCRCQLASPRVFPNFDVTATSSEHMN